MRVIIVDHYGGIRHHIEGSEEDCKRQLLDLYSYLLQKYGNQCDIRILYNLLRSPFKEKHQTIIQYDQHSDET